jgi:protein phosphatase 4 regulatory subunit 3
LDDSTLNVINSCIIFNQVDIINHVQNDKAFLTQIVEAYLDDNVAGVSWWRERLKEMDKPKPKKDDAMEVDESPLFPEVKPQQDVPAADSSSKSSSTAEQADRRSVIVLIQQLCAMGKNVLLPTRLSLFRTLVDRAILFPVQWALSHDEKDDEGRQMIAAAGEILCVLLDHDLHGVRGFVLRQTTEAEQNKGETLLMLMCKIITRSRDLAVQCQVGDALKLMLEIPIVDPNDQSQVRSFFP